MRGIRRADMDDVDGGVGDCLIGARIGALHTQMRQMSRSLFSALRARCRYTLQRRAGKPARPGMNRAHHSRADDCHTECLSHFLNSIWLTGHYRDPAWPDILYYLIRFPTYILCLSSLQSRLWLADGLSKLERPRPRHGYANPSAYPFSPRHFRPSFPA